MDQLKQGALAICLFAAFYDLFTKRIPNWLSFPAIVFGLLAQVHLHGWVGLQQGVLAAVFAFILFYPLFYFRIMGAGDVKLLMAVGAWTEIAFVWRVALVAILCGGIYAAIDTLLRGRLPHVLRVTGGLLHGWLGRAQADDMLSRRKFSFGFAIAAAVALVWGLGLQGVLL